MPWDGIDTEVPFVLHIILNMLWGGDLDRCHRLHGLGFVILTLSSLAWSQLQATVHIDLLRIDMYSCAVNEPVV